MELTSWSRRFDELRERASKRRCGEGSADLPPTEHINFFAAEEEELAKAEASKGVREKLDESSRLGGDPSMRSPWYAQVGSSLYKPGLGVDNLPSRIRREKEEVAALRRRGQGHGHGQLGGTLSQRLGHDDATVSGRSILGESSAATHEASRPPAVDSVRDHSKGSKDKKKRSKKDKKDRRDRDSRKGAGSEAVREGRKVSILELRKERMLREQAERKKERKLVAFSL